MVAIFNDPGVYVVQKIIPVPATPQIPTQAAAIIGPLFQIVDQDIDSESDFTIEEETLNNFESVTVQYPNLISADNPIDLNSVKVELVKPDGRRKTIPETFTNSTDAEENLLEVTPAGVDISFGTETSSYEFFQGVNDEWLGKEVEYEDNGDDNWGGLVGAKIHINYRSVREDLVGRVLEAQGQLGTQIQLGKFSKENPLGLAGGIVASIAPNTGAYYVPTKDYLTEVSNEGSTIDQNTEVQGALERLQPIRAYGIAVLTDSETVQQLVTNHVNVMSDPEEKMYRFAWTYKPLPSEEEVREYLKLSEEDELTSVTLKDGQKDILTQYATSVSDRRTALLYNDFTLEIDGVEEELPGYYLCAAYAALKSVLVPQQGLTNYPIGGVVNKLKYGKDYFRPSQLRELSAGGVFACIQDVASAPIRSRAQWTTNTLNNKTKQTSIVYTVDFFSWSVIDTLEPLIGIRNVTEDTLNEIRETLEALINAMRTAGVIINAEIVYLEQNEDDASQVDVQIRAEFPSPLDKIVITLEY